MLKNETFPVSVWDIKPGDVIRDDVPVIVTAVSPVSLPGSTSPHETTIFVTDCNGYSYMGRRDGGTVQKYDWTREDWNRFVNLP